MEHSGLEFISEKTGVVLALSLGVFDIFLEWSLECSERKRIRETGTFLR